VDMGNSKSKRLSILIVDDDDQVRDMLCDIFTTDGHYAKTCPDAYTAIKAIEKQLPDLIIADLGLPGMSGLDLAGEVHHCHPDLPIAMITGWGAQLDMEKITANGVKTVISKPFHIKDINTMIKDLIGV